ncbi:MAG TPA: substrate-binding domain-containing protein, partial [Tepidisphaeraceae bacterium]
MIAAQAHSLPCDGLITDRDIGLESLLRKAGFPVVSLSDRAGAENAHIVAFDDHAVGRLAAEHFLDQGHWQFACVTYGVGEIGWETKREAGFAERLKEAGRSYTPLRVNDLPLDPQSPHTMSQHDAIRQRAIGAFLKALPKPLAVFGCDDTLAVMVADACQRVLLNIPADVALLGVNNDPMCELTGPPLSSIALPSEQVGYEAIATVSALLRGCKDVQRRTLLPP